MLVYTCNIDDSTTKIASVCHAASQEDVDSKIARMLVTYKGEVEIGKTYSAIPCVEWVYSAEKKDNILIHGKIINQQSLDESGRYLVD